MGVRIKFGDCVPFPTDPGMWLRLVMSDSPEQQQAIVITQGHVLRLDGEKVMLMDQYQETNIDVIREGDQLCINQGLTVVYLPITGVGLVRKAQSNGQTKH